MLKVVIERLSSFNLFTIYELQDIRKKLSACGDEGIWTHLSTLSDHALHDAGVRILSAIPGNMSWQVIQENYSPSTIQVTPNKGGKQ
jgi:hypothetical protein